MLLSATYIGHVLKFVTHVNTRPLRCGLTLTSSSVLQPNEFLCLHAAWYFQFNCFSAIVNSVNLVGGTRRDLVYGSYNSKCLLVHK